MKGDRFDFEIIVDGKNNKVPKVGHIHTIVSKSSNGKMLEKNYKIDKYTSCEIINNGKKNISLAGSNRNLIHNLKIM